MLLCFEGGMLLHKPVMRQEVLDIVPVDGKLMIDFTFGLGGHSKAVVDKYSQYRVIGFDRDEEALKKSNVDSRLELVQASFVSACEYVNERNLKPDFVLFDLGVSSLQLDSEERGFSFTKDSPLDMRMDQSQKLRAIDLIEKADLAELVDIFQKYGEETYAKKIAKSIVSQRKIGKIKTTLQLAEIIKKAKPKNKRRHHPATLVFQALRIAVNDELAELEILLDNIPRLAKRGSVVAALTFNSLEDRIVKRKFSGWRKRCICPPEILVCECKKKVLVKAVTKNFLLPAENELKDNPRSRSAKLRAVEFL